MHFQHVFRILENTIALFLIGERNDLEYDMLRITEHNKDGWNYAPLLIKSQSSLFFIIETPLFYNIKSYIYIIIAPILIQPMNKH